MVELVLAVALGSKENRLASSSGVRRAIVQVGCVIDELINVVVDEIRGLERLKGGRTKADSRGSNQKETQY